MQSWTMVDAQGSPAANDHADVDDVVGRARQVLELARQGWQVDAQEAQDALNRASNDMCADKAYFRQRIEEIRTRLVNAMNRFNEVVASVYQTKAGVNEDLLGRLAPLWFGLTDQVDAQSTAVSQHLSVDDWSGQAAQGYQMAVIAQQQAMIELREMSRTNGQAVQQAALVNTAIFQATVITLDSVISVLRSFGSTPSLGDNYYQRSYFKRSDTAAAQLEYVTQWMQKVDAPQSDAARCATEVATQLDRVLVSGANLGGGSWPPATAGEVVSAQIGGAEFSQTQVHAGHTSAQGAGTLDR